MCGRRHKIANSQYIGTRERSIGSAKAKRDLEEGFALYRIEFYRIVIDEAHEIKNHRSLSELFLPSLEVVG